MLYLITGDNKPEISTFISNLKKDNSGVSIHEFGKENKPTVIDVVDLVNSSGMFSNKKIILLAASKMEDIEFDTAFLTDIANDKETDLYILDEGISKLSKVYQAVKKAAVLKEFSTPRDYSNFNLSDAIFIESDKGKFLKLLQEYEDIETEAPLITSIIYMGLRNLVSVKTNNNTASKLHPFVKKKTTASKLKIKDIKKTYMDLLELDIKTKSNSGRKRDLIEDFMLYSI